MKMKLAIMVLMFSIGMSVSEAQQQEKSMGGFGTWDLAQAAPERFAAIAPLCGGGNLDRLCVMRNLPVWAFQRIWRLEFQVHYS